MRIVAGIAKGRKLVVPKGLGVRPTTDRVREALFSAIGSRIARARVLDLFAGSGALGLESLSRGAKTATFIEKDTMTLKILDQNIRSLDFTETARIIGQNARDALKQLEKENQSFDLVFLDPPYQGPLLTQSLDALEKSTLLSADGLIIAEHPAELPVFNIKGFHVVSTKRYGKTILSFVQRVEEIWSH